MTGAGLDEVTGVTPPGAALVVIVLKTVRTLIRKAPVVGAAVTVVTAVVVATERTVAVAVKVLGAATCDTRKKI